MGFVNKVVELIGINVSVNAQTEQHEDQVNYNELGISAANPAKMKFINLKYSD